MKKKAKPKPIKKPAKAKPDKKSPKPKPVPEVAPTEVPETTVIESPPASPIEIVEAVPVPEVTETKNFALGSPGTVVPDPLKVAQGTEGELQAVVDSAQSPCVIVVKSEGDVRRVQDLLQGKQGSYQVRLNPKIHARAMWRRSG